VQFGGQLTQPRRHAFGVKELAASVALKVFPLVFPAVGRRSAVMDMNISQKQYILMGFCT
jgi:hypothetical protein